MAMFRRSTTLFVLALAVGGAACADKKDEAAADAELARDLALVNQQPATPQFSDSAIGTAPEPRRVDPPPRQTRTTRPSTPARQTTPVVAQRPRPSEPAPTIEQPAPAPVAAPAPRAPGFDAGTSFGVTTKSPVCTTNRPGDKIVATLNQGVTGTNGAYLPAGTTVVLEVASVTPGSTPESAQISLRVRSIVIDDQVVNVPADVAILSDLERREIPRTSGSDKKKVIGGAIAGAVIGQVLGKDTRSTVIGAAAGGAAGAAAAAASRKYDACLPAGGSARVTTSQQITLSD
jgi:hypothetical protein